MSVRVVNGKIFQKDFCLPPLQYYESVWPVYVLLVLYQYSYSDFKQSSVYTVYYCAFPYTNLKYYNFVKLSLTTCSLGSDATKIQSLITPSDAISLYLIARKPVNKLPGEKLYTAEVPAGLRLGCRGNCPPPFPSCSFLFFFICTGSVPAAFP